MIHRIRRAVFELRLGDEPTAFRRRAQMEEVFQRTILPVLEEAFDRLAPDDRVVNLDSLGLDLGRIDPGAVDEARLRETILVQLTSRLQALPPEPRAPAAAASSVEETLAAFLGVGAWPWHTGITSTDALEAALTTLPPLEAQGVVRRLIPLLRRSGVRLRVAYQFRTTFARWVMEQLVPGRADDIERLASEIGTGLSPGMVAAGMLAAGVHLADDATAPRASLARSMVDEHRHLQRLERGGNSMPAPSLQEILGLQRTLQNARGEQDGEPHTLYVSCAGVVLLHPFLDRFFRVVGLVTDDRPLASFAQRARAVHLLYHLATAREQPDEHETTLLKLLAGLPIDYPLPRELDVSANERDEADRMLAAAIRHWDKLKNTSPAGLRDAFVQREGKLAARDDGWRLTVEQRPVDILLDSLPWSLSIVRLPWMIAPLWVDWA